MFHIQKLSDQVKEILFNGTGEEKYTLVFSTKNTSRVITTTYEGILSKSSSKIS